jgi:hypothetical protein
MLPTITDEIRQKIAKDYIGYGLVVFLINKPDLGYDDTPTQAEYNKRRELSMQQAVLHEVGGPSLNGYKRYYTEEPLLRNTSSSSSLIIKAEFQAVGNTMPVFTHACVARGANIFSMSPANGNNRGDFQGQLVATIPVTSRLLSDGSRGLLLEPPEVYKITIPININSFVV